MMESDKVFLRHILDEIEFVIKRSQNLDLNKLLDDEVLKRAVARSMEIIGEASKKLSEEFKKKNNEVEWKKIAGLRDKIIHYYFGVNWDIVWDVIRNHLPELKEKISKTLNS